MDDNYKIVKDDSKNLEKQIFLKLNSNELINLLSNKSNTHIIIKFGATWCVPCKRIEDTLNNLFIHMPDNVSCYELDVDEIGGSSISDLDSDVSKLKEFATGKNPTLREMVQNKKRKDKAINVRYYLCFSIDCSKSFSQKLSIFDVNGFNFIL